MILIHFQILISSNVNKVRNTLIVKIQEFVIHVIRDLKESKVANLALLTIGVLPFNVKNAQMA